MVNVQFQDIPTGNAGTGVTVKEMINESIQGSVDLPVITTARKIVLANNVNPRNEREIADHLFFWVKEHIHFVRDPVYAELLQSPRRTLEAKQGDCDDLSTLLASLNLAVGNIPRFVTVAHVDPDQFSHVYLQVMTDKGWVSYDAVVRESVPGWEVKNFVNKAFWAFNISDVNVGMGNVFDKIYDELKRFERRVRKEVRRAARRIRDEKRRTFKKITEEFARWEKMGMFGKFLVLGVKILMPGFIFFQFTKNPFKLTSDEWMMFAKLGMTITSAVLSIVSGGAAIPLLTASVLSLANTGISAYELKENIDARKDVIKQLKEASVQFAVEERTQREAIEKLETDNKILELIENKARAYLEESELFQAENRKKTESKEMQMKIRNIDLATEYRIQKEREFSNFRRKDDQRIYVKYKAKIDAFNSLVNRINMIGAGYEKAKSEFDFNLKTFQDTMAYTKVG